MTPLEERLRAALRTAMRSRDAVATAALRSALGAVANAGAVPGSVPPSASEHVAGAAAGVGATEVPRRSLTPADVEAIVRAEIAERLAAAETYPGPAAERTRAEAAVLSALL